MSLADDLATPAASRGPLCSVNVILSELTPELRTLVEDRIANQRYTSTQIAKALSNNGHPIGDTSIQRHRRQECACSRTEP